SKIVSPSRMRLCPCAVITRIGAEVFSTAHTVEALLEHQSIPSSEFVERTAAELRKEVRVKFRAPSKLASSSLPAGSDTRTVVMICELSMVPLFLRSFLGLSVQHKTPVLRSASSALPL